jgi:hypothetical protein
LMLAPWPVYVLSPFRKPFASFDEIILPWLSNVQKIGTENNVGLGRISRHSSIPFCMLGYRCSLEYYYLPIYLGSCLVSWDIWVVIQTTPWYTPVAVMCCWPVAACGCLATIISWLCAGSVLWVLVIVLMIVSLLGHLCLLPSLLSAACHCCCSSWHLPIALWSSCCCVN